MPRTGRGGSRQSAIGSASGNRTDLNAHVPIAVAPNQPYGEAAQQRIAQQAIPMAPTQVAPAAAQTAPSAPVAPTPSAPARQHVAPGSLPWLHPTNRPDEPVTEGMPFGPGGGPVNIPPPRVSAQLMSMAQNGGSDMLSNIAASAQAMGL